MLQMFNERQLWAVVESLSCRGHTGCFNICGTCTWQLHVVNKKVWLAGLRAGNDVIVHKGLVTPGKVHTRSMPCAC